MSVAIRESTSADQRHDFQPIAFAQHVLAMSPPRHYFEVHLDGHRLVGQLELVEQLGNGKAVGRFARLSIENDLHGVRRLRRAQCNYCNYCNYWQCGY
jgi:hypothetical protein